MDEHDLCRNYNWKVLCEGIITAHFTVCSGLAVKVESIPYREGGDSSTIRKLPGRVEYCDVELRYGLTDSTDMWKWLMTAVNGKADRKDISIVLLDPSSSKERIRYNLFQTWITQWHGAHLNALDNEIAVDTIKIACDYVELG